MKKYLFLIAALFASSAFAIGIGNDNPASGGTAVATQGQAQGQLQGQAQFTAVGVEVSNRIANDTRSAATSFAQGGASGAVAASGGSTSGVNFQITSPKNTPSVFAGNMYPTTSCAQTSTVGGSGVGFGVAFGTSWTDEECSLRETARSFQGLGKIDDAVHILCSSKFSAAAPTCKAMAPTVPTPKE